MKRTNPSYRGRLAVAAGAMMVLSVFATHAPAFDSPWADWDPAAPTVDEQAQSGAIGSLTAFEDSDTADEAGLAGQGCDDCCGSHCGDCCGSACGSCDDCSRRRLLGVFAPTARGFDRFISPITNPVFFEDPRTLTEVRTFYLRHKVPAAAGGGDINLWAAQIRAALTDRLSIVAAKDGYATSSNLLIDDGWADVSLGLKYNLLANWQTQTLLSAGVAYELPVGSPRTLQGNGDGLFNLYLTGGTQIAGMHWISASGFLLPSDPAAESSIWFWSNHFDQQIGATPLYGLFEFNWYHWMGAGNGGIPGVEGGDLFNFGSTGVAGNDIVTGAFGLKLKPSRNLEFGVAWEAPLTNRRDVLHDRLTVDLILRY